MPLCTLTLVILFLWILLSSLFGHHVDSRNVAPVTKILPGLQLHGTAVPEHTLQKPSLILLMGINLGQVSR